MAILVLPANYGLDFANREGLLKPMRALSYCGEQVRRSDNDRFLCAQFAPVEVREDLYALFAFNIELARIPERVSEPLLGDIRYQWWRDGLEAVYGGNAPQHEVIGPLSKTVRAFDLDHAVLERIIDTRRQDLDETPIADMVAFDAYADGTAGTLAQLTLDVLGIADPPARKAAQDIAYASAAVAILRAVPFHAARGQVFIPRQSLEAAGVGHTSVLSGVHSSGVERAVEQLADYAERRLAAARKPAAEMPPAALPALLPAVLADGWLTRLRKARYNPFDPALQRIAPLRPLRVWFQAWRGRY